MRMFRDGIGQQAALIETHVARRRANQARHGVAFHIFRHIEANQLEPQDLGHLARDFGLTHSRRARE